MPTRKFLACTSAILAVWFPLSYIGFLFFTSHKTPLDPARLLAEKFIEAGVFTPFVGVALGIWSLVIKPRDKDKISETASAGVIVGAIVSVFLLLWVFHIDFFLAPFLP